MDSSFRKLCWQRGTKQRGSNSFKGEFKKFFLAAPHKILVPQSGVKLVPPEVEAWSPNHWTARKALESKYVSSENT